MKKYIKSYSEINESVTRGAVILIKGKQEGEKKKLYAAHVMSCVTLPQGAMMLFLADEFYRIKEEGEGLKAVKISYKNEASLKSALNLKSPGKISIVKNNNKTPLHWKTLKHTSINSALKDVEGEIKNDSYLFESAEMESANSNEKMWEDFLNLVVTKTANTVFFGKNEIDILEYRLDNEGLYKEIWDSPSDDVSVEWTLDFEVLLGDPEFEKYISAFNLAEHSMNISFLFASNVSMNTIHDPGDYWNPPYTDSEIGSVNNELTIISIDGEPIESNEVSDLINRINLIKYSGPSTGYLSANKRMDEMLADELEEFILINLDDQLLMKKGD